MSRRHVTLAVGDWPAIDRQLWHDATRPAGFLETHRRASLLGRHRHDFLERAYGRWLVFLDRRGELDPAQEPLDRVTEARVSAFVTDVRSRLSPVSILMVVEALKVMLDCLVPGAQRPWLEQVCRGLKRDAEPSRDKRGSMVPPGQLLSLGLHLMDSCHQARQQNRFAATRYRDGLIIATLISCPVRVGNLAAITVGRHLVVDDRRYMLRFSAAETKNDRPYIAALPRLLTPYIDGWLQTWRPLIQRTATGGPGDRSETAMWIGCFGTPMLAASISHQIRKRTRAAFGRHVWAHLFRDIAVTELVDMAPEEIGIAPDLLGHADLQTTKKHYIQAVGMQAHARVQEVIAARRRTAAPRG
jgi:hypothetical protein